MERQEYTIKRDELIDIFTHIQAEIQKNPKNEEKYFPTLAQNLKIRSKRLSEDQFKMVLCGAFQSGKSTAFNAICGGRSLSPTGFGIKTSACLVEAHYLSDPNAEEYAKICLRSIHDIVDGFQAELGPAITKTDADDKSGLIKEGSPIHDYFDVFDEKYLNLLSKVVDKELEQHDKDASKYSPERLDIVKYSKIVVDAIKSGEVKKEWLMRASYECSLDEAKNSIKFPIDFSVKWKMGDFSFEEVKWAFINKVELHLKGVSQMSEFGFVLVDAPGLFTSDWDSNLTLTAINNADAVLFIISGDKEIDRGTITAIRKIKADDGAGNVPMFLGFNQRKDEDATRDIILSSISKLRDAGLKFEKDEYVNFHARLSLNLLLYKESDDLRLIRDIKNDASFCYDIDILKSKESVMENEEVLREKASLDKLVFKGSNFIAKNRGAIVLKNHVDNVLGILKEAQGGNIRKILDTTHVEMEAKRKELCAEEKRFESFKRLRGDLLRKNSSEYKKLTSDLENIILKKIDQEFNKYLNGMPLSGEDVSFKDELCKYLNEQYKGFRLSENLNEYLSKALSQILTNKIENIMRSIRDLEGLKAVLDHRQGEIMSKLKEGLEKEEISLIKYNEIEVKYPIKKVYETINAIMDGLWNFWDSFCNLIMNSWNLWFRSDESKCQTIVKRLFEPENLKKLKEELRPYETKISKSYAKAYANKLYDGITSYCDQRDRDFKRILESLKSDFDKSDSNFKELQKEVQQFSTEFLEPSIAQLESYRENIA